MVDYNFYFEGLKENKLPNFIKRNLYNSSKIDFLNYANKIVGKKKLLNCACGDNGLKEAFETKKYIGFDKRVSKNDFDYKKVDIVGDAHYLSKYIKGVDNIISFGTIEHVKNPEKVLEEFRKVIKKDGNLFICFPHMFRIHLNPYDYWRFTYYGVHEILSRHGFKVCHMISNGGVFTVITTFIRDIFMKLPKLFNYILTICVWLPSQLIATKLDAFDMSKRHTICYFVHAKKCKN